MIVTADWVLPVCEPPVRHGAVAVREGVVVEVGMAADVCSRWMDDTDTVELDGCIVAPGLVNAHTHLSLTVLAGLTPPAPLPDWLPRVTRAVLGLAPEDLGASAALGALECLLSGTTVVGDIVYGVESARAAAGLGLGGAFCWELLGMDADAVAPSLERRGWPTAGDAHALGPEERVEAGISPHSPYTAGPGLLSAAHAFARRHGVPCVIHVAESEDELAVVRDGSGPLAGRASRLAPDFAPAGLTPVAYLASLGALDDSVCVHAVHVTDRDRELLAERARAVVLCPRSNAWLDNGAPEVAALRLAGVRTALGTDSSASNEDLNLFAELAALREIDPTIGADEALWTVTLAGAQALGLAGSFGTLLPGSQADLVAVRASAEEAGGDPVEAFLAAGAAGVVDSVMTGGEWAVRDAMPVFDTRGLRERAARAAETARRLVES